MSSDTSKLTRKLRRAMNQTARNARLSRMLTKARAANHVLRRRNKTLRRALAERELSLSLTLGTLRQAS